MKKTVNDIKYLCNLLQYMSREPGLFSNGYISYISIGRYAKYVDLHFMNGSVYNFDSYTKNFLYDQLLRYAKIHFFYIQNSFKYHYRNKVCKQVCIFFYFLILIVFVA